MLIPHCAKNGALQSLLLAPALALQATVAPSRRSPTASAVTGTSIVEVATMSGDGTRIAGLGQNSAGQWLAWEAFDGSSSTLGTRACSPAAPNATGAPGRLRVAGSDYAAANDVTLVAEQLASGSFALFLTSLTPSAPVTPPGSVGARCIDGGIGRYLGAGQVRPAGPVGVIAISIDLTNTPTPTGPTAMLAGQTWHFQAWYRDVALGLPTSNFTDSVGLTLR